MGVAGQISKELERAKQSGRFLVMISYIDKNTELLEHRTFTNDFPIGDFDRSITEHTKHLDDQKNKPKKEQARGTLASEEDKKDSPA